MAIVGGARNACSSYIGMRFALFANFKKKMASERKGEPMQFIAGGGGDEIGASFYVTAFDDGTVIAVDCGGRPSSGFNPEVSVVGFSEITKEFLPPEPDFSIADQIDFLLLTHGHLDHVLMAPILARRHPRMRIFATPATKAFCSYHWSDTIKRAEKNNVVSPYTEDEYERTLERIEVFEVSANWLTLIQLTDHLSFTAVPAGHILGAVSYIIHENGQPVGFYSGDIAPFDQRTVLGASPVAFGHLRYMVVESTRLTERNEPRQVVDERFITAIADAANQGMSVRILGFAIGRSQETYQLAREAVGDSVPIYLEGAAQRISDIYLKYSPDGLIKPSIRNSYVADKEQRYGILAANEPSIVIIPSAMQFGGLALLYAKHGVYRRDHLFVSAGWLDPCSPEYRFFDDKARVLRIRKETFPILCQKKRLGLTAHCDGTDVMAMRERMRPDTTVLIHGDNERIDQFLNNHPGEGYVKGENNTPLTL